MRFPPYIADETADPDKIAADMLSQAEHGSGLEQALTVTTDETMPEKIIKALEQRKATLPRMATVDKVLDKGSWIIVVKDQWQRQQKVRFQGLCQRRCLHRQIR